MNRQLISKACGKFAEGFALLEQGMALPEDEVTQTNATVAASPSATEASSASQPKAAKAAGKKAPAKKAAPVVEESEDEESTEDEELEESEDEGTEDDAQDEGEEQDDLEDLEDEAPAAPAKAAAPKFTKEQIRKKLVEFGKAHGKKKAYALLEKYGSKNVDGLKPASLDKLMKDLVTGMKK